MTSAIDGLTDSVPVRMWTFLRGPRFIDLPIRVLALIMGLTILVPGSFEITEPRYSALLILGYAFIVLAAFQPLTIVIAATGLGALFSSLYPDLENMFPEALLLATAVLISRRRWAGFALGTAALAGYLGFSTWLGSYDAGFEGLTDLGYGWLTYSILGLCASFVEARIRREMDRRERAAVDHQKTLDAMRARFTSDMHDTISHSLTTESAIIRTLARETDSENSARLLAELALVNAEATKRLRQLVSSLSKWETETCAEDSRTSRIRFRAEAQALTTAIEDGCAAGSVPLTTELSSLPTYASSTFGHHFRAVMLELATNVIRHSTPGTPATLSVEMRDGASERPVIVCRSRNESPASLTQVPRSLGRRATAVGGTCEVGTDDKNAIVEVALPVRFLAESAGAKSIRTTARGASSATDESDAMIDVIDVTAQEKSTGSAETGPADNPRDAGVDAKPTGHNDPAHGDSAPGLSARKPMQGSAGDRDTVDV
jgi:signal transduction histidine kinase